MPRSIIQGLLLELDPSGTEARKRHRLKRREYVNPGPNFAWHIDGYDKLKPFGFPVHGGIDGFSRKMLWLKVERSNNSPEKIASLYLNAVNEFDGCPIELITDLGTKNGLAASIQSYFRDDPDAHRYVPSPRNQRIESWWSSFAKQRTMWWRSFFQDLEFQSILDLSSEIHKEALWYCFANVLRRDFDFVKHHWNTHRIRKSRHNTVAGRPDSLYFLPTLHGGENNLKKEISKREQIYISTNIVQIDESNDYQEYFDYVRNQLSFEAPDDWESALSLFKELVQIADHGT